MRARSSMALSLRRGRCRRRSACRIRVAAALLTVNGRWKGRHSGQDGDHNM